MAAEKLVWVNMREALSRHCSIGRVENAVEKGWPDVSGSMMRIGDFWVELKGMLKWPKVPDNRIIQLDHDLTLNQRLWLKERWLNGSNCWVLLGIRQPKQWLMWDGLTAAQHVGLSTLADLSRVSVFDITQNEFPLDHFITALRHRAQGRQS